MIYLQKKLNHTWKKQDSNFLCFSGQSVLSCEFKDINIYIYIYSHKIETTFTQLTNGQCDHRFVGVRLDGDIFHDRSYGIVCLPSDVGGANIPTFTKTGYGHLVVHERNIRNFTCRSFWQRIVWRDMCVCSSTRGKVYESLDNADSYEIDDSRATRSLSLKPQSRRHVNNRNALGGWRTNEPVGLVHATPHLLL